MFKYIEVRMTEIKEEEGGIGSLFDCIKARIVNQEKRNLLMKLADLH